MPGVVEHRVGGVAEHSDDILQDFFGVDNPSFPEIVSSFAELASPVIDALDSEDLDMRLKGHDRMIKMLNGKDPGLSLNIENASGIEISFKDFGGKNEDKGTPGSDA